MIKKVCALSETGLKRTVNQDSILSLYSQEAGLFIIADGMGGHFRGELASELVVSKYTDWWKTIEQCICGMEVSEIVAELENLLTQTSHLNKCLCTLKIQYLAVIQLSMFSQLRRLQLRF